MDSGEDGVDYYRRCVDRRDTLCRLQLGLEQDLMPVGYDEQPYRAPSRIVP